MKSEYLYGIVIVVILLVLLFVYNMMKGAPTTPATPPANTNTTVVPTTMTISYSNTQGGTMVLSVVNAKTVTSSSTIPSGANSVLIGSAGSANGITIPLYSIQYDGHGINFVVDTSASSSSSRYYVQNLSIWGISSIVDSNSSHPFYNTNTATVNGQVLTLTNGNDKLLIQFPNAFA